MEIANGLHQEEENREEMELTDKNTLQVEQEIVISPHQEDGNATIIVEKERVDEGIPSETTDALNQLPSPVPAATSDPHFAKMPERSDENPKDNDDSTAPPEVRRDSTLSTSDVPLVSDHSRPDSLTHVHYAKCENLHKPPMN